MNAYLPSRKVVAFVIIPLFTIFILWFLGQYNQKQISNKQLKQQELEATLGTAVDAYNKRDTDGDLLKDWEEFLYETDIEKQDTDGDGLDDYQEVLDPIRDPLVADAQLGRYQASTTKESGESVYYAVDPQLNATEKFSRDIYNTFAQVKQSDSPEQIKQVLVERVADSVYEREEKQALYTMADITIVPSLGVEKDRQLYLGQYQKAVAPLRELVEQDNELLLMVQYSKTKDGIYLKRMQNNLSKHQEFVSNLLAMRVPESAKEVHLELLNNYGFLIQNIEKMSQTETDPVGGLLSASYYYDDSQYLQNTFHALSLFLGAK